MFTSKITMTRNKLTFKRLVIISFLILLWIVLTVFNIFNYNLSLSVISYTHSKDNFYNFTTKRIFAGDKISGEFQAEEDYLGIVSVGFSTFEEVSYSDQDVLVFRIKEKGADKWYYENTYRSGLIYEVPFLPFGFPIIENSMNKTYVFEIESLRGNSLNAVTINPWGPTLVSRYQIPEEKLLDDRQYLLSFFVKKIMVSLENRDVVFYSLIYLLPLIFYLVVLYPSKFLPGLEKPINRISYRGHNLYSPAIRRFVRQNSRYFLILVPIPIVLFDIIFTKSSNDIIFIVVGALWFVVLFSYKITYRFSLIVGLVFLIISFFLLYFSLSAISEMSAAWAYIFFVVGTIQMIFELRNKKD